MTDISFYHVKNTVFEKSICRLLDKIYSSGYKALVVVKDEDFAANLDKILWSFASKAFVPHGVSNEDKADEQPILIATDTENKNQADLLMLTHYIDVDIAGFKRVIYIFDDNDEQITAARQQYKRYKDAGHELAYYKQQPKGDWVNMGEAT